MGEKQIQRGQVGSGNVANAQLAVRPAEREGLPGQKVLAQIVVLKHTFYVLFNALGRSVRGELASFGRLLHATQKLKRMFEFAVRVARLRGLLELAKFLV